MSCVNNSFVEGEWIRGTSTKDVLPRVGVMQASRPRPPSRSEYVHLYLLTCSSRQEAKAVDQKLEGASGRLSRGDTIYDLRKHAMRLEITGSRSGRLNGTRQSFVEGGPENSKRTVAHGPSNEPAR
jgi:hypothetical protein